MYGISLPLDFEVSEMGYKFSLSQTSLSQVTPLLAIFLNESHAARHPLHIYPQVSPTVHFKVVAPSAYTHTPHAHLLP